LKALFGLSGEFTPLKSPNEDLAIYHEATGLEAWPAGPFKESYVIAGRRSGKSTIAAVIAVYLALFYDWRKHLSPGERGYIFLIAVNKSQASILKNYIEALLNLQPSFKRMISKVLTEEIELTNQVTISIKPASFRTVRGFTLLAVILEELSFWRFETESANPDVEIARALRPGLGSVPQSLLIGISSPFSKQGLIYEMFKRWHGVAGGPLIWRAPTSTMNPVFSKDVIARAFEDDPESAAAEYGAEFRTDLSSYVEPEAIEACVIPNRRGLAFIEGKKYHAFIDPSGGRDDSFTLAIAHRENDIAVLDVALERLPPFRPEDVVDEFSKVLQDFKIFKVKADSYAGEWVTSSFETKGIDIINSDKSKSEIYRELLPLINNGSLELLDLSRLTSQAKNLDRRTRSGGRETIDVFHGHDDVINAAAGALVLAAGSGPMRRGRLTYSGGPVHAPRPKDELPPPGKKLGRFLTRLTSTIKTEEKIMDKTQLLFDDIFENRASDDVVEAVQEFDRHTDRSKWLQDPKLKEKFIAWTTGVYSQLSVPLPKEIERKKFEEICAATKFHPQHVLKVLSFFGYGMVRFAQILRRDQIIEDSAFFFNYPWLAGVIKK
jgi:hypothetical protein